MEAVQIVLDKKLLEATDQAAPRRQNRLAPVRDALRERLRNLGIRAREARDREGYSRSSPALDKSLPWETEAAWPPTDCAIPFPPIVFEAAKKFSQGARPRSSETIR